MAAGVGVIGLGAVGALVAVPLLTLLATGAARAESAGPPAGAACTLWRPPPSGGTGGGGAGAVRLDREQVTNARLVVEVARRMRLPVRAAGVGLTAAMQESSLRNLDHGDAAGPDSRGLFQQRPVYYPGVDVLDPDQASRAFYRRLVAVPGWEDLPVWQAAQAVQHSADGHAYARWQGFGLALAAALYQGRPAVVGAEEPGTGGTANTGLACDPAGPRPDAPAAARQVRTVLAAAGSQLGRPYVWGGGNANGPTGGVHGVQPPGFDCSGLVLYAFAQVGIALPHSSAAQYRAGRHVPVSQARAGDLIFLSSDGTPGGIHHVALVWSSTQIIEAADFGIPVRVRTFAGRAEPQIMPDAVRII